MSELGSMLAGNEQPANASDLGSRVPVETTVNGRLMVYLKGEGWMTRDRWEEEFALFTRRPVHIAIDRLPGNIPKPGTVGGPQPAVLDRLNKMTTTEDRSKNVMEKKMKKDELEQVKEATERALFGLTPIIEKVRASGATGIGSLVLIILLFWMWWRSR
jgi:hypothetical protein